MAQTTLKPWLEGYILADVESTKVLTPEEKEIVNQGVRLAFSWWNLPGEPPPSIVEIKRALGKANSTISEKLICIDYHY